MDNQVIDTPNSFGNNQNLPHSTAILVLGIVSIVTCWCYGVPGLTCSIIALVYAKKDKALLDANPGMYNASSQNNVKAGKICAIIGLCLSILFVIYIIVLITILGSDMSKLDWQEIFKK